MSVKKKRTIGPCRGVTWLYYVVLLWSRDFFLSLYLDPRFRPLLLKWHAKVMRQDLLVVVWGCWFAVLGKALQVIKNPFHFIHQRCQITSTSDVTALNV